MIIAVTTSSHRQINRLPDGRAKSPSSGLPVSLGSKTRIWFYEDTPENRERLKGFKVHKGQTAKWNQYLSVSINQNQKEQNETAND